jgi:hypothetical protein
VFNKPAKKPQDVKSDFYIMIVDDEKGFLDSITYWFTSQGYQVQAFMSGVEAIEMIRTRRPGIVFLNLQMPQGEGLETLRVIRELDNRLPVVMLSAFGEEEMSVDAYKLGVNGFFDKSSNFYKAEHLINTLVRVIARRYGAVSEAQGKKLRKKWWFLRTLIFLLLALGLIFGVVRWLVMPQVCFKGNVCLRVQLADTEEERQKGLMYRRFLPPGEGMLFVFPQEALWGFWMKNTRIPLDIIWIETSGTVVGVARHVQPSDLAIPPVLKNDKPAKFVLEANAGFAHRHGIVIGDKAEIR